MLAAAGCHGQAPRAIVVNGLLIDSSSVNRIALSSNRNEVIHALKRDIPDAPVFCANRRCSGARLFVDDPMSGMQITYAFRGDELVRIIAVFPNETTEGSRQDTISQLANVLGPPVRKGEGYWSVNNARTTIILLRTSFTMQVKNRAPDAQRIETAVKVRALDIEE
ncbi:MAG TPA: hypothetical protein PKN93_15630 [Leptospiraceae bacterium]|nr:hypothetical protein [Leptospiraceae bacterium]